MNHIDEEAGESASAARDGDAHPSSPSYRPAAPLSFYTGVLRWEYLPLEMLLSLIGTRVDQNVGVPGQDIGCPIQTFLARLFRFDPALFTVTGTAMRIWGVDDDGYETEIIGEVPLPPAFRRFIELTEGGAPRADSVAAYRAGKEPECDFSRYMTAGQADAALMQAMVDTGTPGVFA